MSPMRRTYHLDAGEILPPLARIPEETRKIAMREAVKVVARTVREVAPDSGIKHKRKLNKSVRYVVARDSWSARVQLKAPHAHLVEAGTSPHVIRATKMAVNLHVMVIPIAGHLLLMAAVHHPGARANPFMERAAALSRDEVNMVFLEAAGEAMDMVL